jgi:hypothetical protein
MSWFESIDFSFYTIEFLLGEGINLGWEEDESD